MTNLLVTIAVIFVLASLVALELHSKGDREGAKEAFFYVMMSAWLVIAVAAVLLVVGYGLRFISYLFSAVFGG